MRIFVAAFMLIGPLVFSTSLDAQAPRLALQSVVQDRLTGPLFVTNAHDQTGRLFILEQRGRVLVVGLGATSSSVSSLPSRYFSLIDWRIGMRSANLRSQRCQSG